MNNYAIILASGKGERFGFELPKQFVKIAGRTILEHTIDIFENSELINGVIIVIPIEYREYVLELISKNCYKKLIKVLNGGSTRKESTWVAINSITDKEANVLIHDCVRPFLSERIIKNCIEALEKYDAIDVAIPTADTIIKINTNGLIDEIPERKFLYRGQTPQCFKLSLIKKAHEISKNDNNFTDDCGIVLKYGLSDVYVVDGDIDNIKITYKSDIYLADRLFQVKHYNIDDDISLSNLQDKVVVIFGGTSGIGKCTANLSESFGAKPYVTSRKLGVNISNYSDVYKFLNSVYEKEGHIDLVINTAGILNIGKLEEKEVNDIYHEIEVNYIGSINVSRASIPFLKKSKGMILLYTSSSYTRGRMLYSIYSSTKAAIVNFMQAISCELYDSGIKVNAINPERCATPMRFNAFGKEPNESLLSPEKVADVSLKTYIANVTGMVVDVRR